MSVEQSVFTTLRGCGAPVFPDVAPLSTPRPFVTYQLIGGRSLRWLDGSASDKRQLRVQVSVWAERRTQATDLIRAIEDAMCAAAAFQARPDGEPLTDVDADGDPVLYAAIQDFTVIGLR